MNTTAQPESAASRLRTLVAALVAFLMIAAGVGVAAPAAAAEGASAVGAVVSASDAGLEVRVEFSGVPASTLSPPQNQGVYVAVLEADTDDPIGSGAFVPNALIRDGAGSGSYTVAAAALDRDVSYEVLVWYAHGSPTTESIVARAALAVTSEQWDEVFGSEGDNDGEEGDGEEGGSVPSVPSVSVSKSSGLNPAGETIMVTGTGFVANAPATDATRPPIGAGNFGGTYVVFGKWPSDWAPSEGGSRPAAGNLGQRWGVHAAQFGGSVNAGNGGFVLPEDGSFELTFDVSDASELDGNYGIYTYAGGGATYAPFETFTPLTFADSAPVTYTPAIDVYLEDGTTPVADTQLRPGDTIVVKGSGFDPEANVGGRGMPIPNTLPQGAYVVFGNFAEDWRPSGGAASNARKVGSQGWVLPEAVLDQVPTQYQNTIRSQWVELNDDGTFTATLTLKDADEPTGSGAAYGVYTYGAGGVNNADQELAVLLDYLGERPETVFEPSLTVYLADGVTPYTNQLVAEGDELIVKGTGFDPYANYGGLGQPIPADLPQGTFVVFGSFADVWKPSAGATSDKRPHATSARAWLFDEETVNSDPAYNAVRSQWVELDPETGSFEWTVTLAEPDVLQFEGNWGIYTYAGGVNTQNAEQELMVPITFAPKEREDGSGPGAVSGDLQWGIFTRFVNYIESNSDGRVDLLGAATRSGGIFGFTQIPGGEWDSAAETGEVRFSGGIAFSAHGGGLNLTIENPILTVSGSTGLLTARFDHGPQTPFADVDLTAATRTVAADGSVTWTGAKTAMRPEGVASFLNFYPAGTELDPLTFTVGAPAAEPTGPQIDVSVESADADGALIRVDGSAFEGITGAYAALIEKGTEAVVSAAGGYVAFGYWMTPGSIVDGAFSKTLAAKASDLDKSKRYEVIVWEGHAVPGPDTIYARADVPLTTSHWTAIFPPTPPTPTDPEEGPTPPQPTVPGGSLRWAISSDFANYVAGPIAKGDIRVSGGATRSGSQFQFGQAAGSTYNVQTGVGTVSYVGAVRFTGHGGILDVTITNPRIVVHSASSATVYVNSGGSMVALATLNLAAAGKIVANGAVTYNAAPATLTSAGLNRVFAGYATSLNPLTFTIGAPSLAPTGATGTVASAASEEEPLGELPAAPPATSGLQAEGDSLAAFSSGGVGTFSASGFEPNEQGILVVVYSTPVLLDKVTADANGVATWTGSLPATFAEGNHTLTFQGSVAHGLEFALTRLTQTAIGECVVSDATLNWGFKETFRSYIEGIARGGWELTDIEYVFPDFVWTGGSGSLDADTMTGLVSLGGEIQFTGHDGALNTTLANARIELAGETGYIVFDITGTTQGGDDVEARDVRFVEFSLAGAEITDGVLTLDALPSTLTDAGATAFGTYPAGEEFDPVSAVIPVDADCGVVVEPAPTEEPAPAEPGGEEPEAEDAEGAPVWPWIVGGIALLVIIGAAVGVGVSRKRKTATETEGTVGGR